MLYKKILVTGGTGLVGHSFKKIQNNYPNREFIFSSSKDCNLVKSSETINYVKKLNPDAIIHLAAISGGIEFSMKKPATMLRDNVIMNINILEAARVCNIKKVVMTLSSGMYSSDVPKPIKEEYIHDGTPHGSNYSYAFAKRLVDPLVRSYRTEYNMNVIGLIPNGILGENSNYRYDESTMVPALIRRFYENKDKNNKITIWGDGSPLREITFAEDMARAYMWCLDNYDDEQILHIGTTEEHSVKDIAYMIAEIIGVDKNRIDFDTAKPSGQPRKNTDNSKFIKISNFEYTPFKITLEKTIKWFCDNYKRDNIRL